MQLNLTFLMLHDRSGKDNIVFKRKKENFVNEKFKKKTGKKGGGERGRGLIQMPTVCNRGMGGGGV